MAPSGVRLSTRAAGECIVHDAIGLGHGGYLAGQTMTPGVQGGYLFAFVRFGAGGTLRVSAVCFELLLGDHRV